MGCGNMRSAAPYVDVVAIADVDEQHRNQANSMLARPYRSGYEIEM